MAGGGVWAAETGGLTEGNTHSSVGEGNRRAIEQRYIVELRNLEDRKRPEIRMRKTPNA